MNDIRPAPGIDDLVHVSADLRAGGGERAEFSRALGRTLRELAGDRGVRFLGLHLAASDAGPALDDYRSFDGRRRACAWALAGLQLRGARRCLLVFDSPELAALQARIPAPLRARSVVWASDAGMARPRGGILRALARATRVLTHSTATRERLADWLPATSEVTVVHPGLEREPLPGPQRASIVERAGRDFVLTVRTARAGEEVSGQMDLLEAWPGLIDYLPDVWLAVVCDEGDRAVLERRAGQLGLGRLVRFLGPVDPPTLAELHRRAVAFALPSAEEGLGLGLLEAMRAASPCLAPAGAVSSEVVVDRYTGVLVAPGDRVALSRGLAHLLADRERARRMGIAGRARFLHDFTLEALGKRLQPLLDRVLEGAPEPSLVAAPSPRTYDPAERLRLEIETGEPTPVPGSLRAPAPAAATGADADRRESGDFETPAVPIDVASLFDADPGGGDETE